MSRLDTAAARELAARAVALAGADGAEAIVTSGDSALTRFANGHIHQNVAETSVAVSVRAVIGTRQGVASTNRIDDEGLSECCASAVEAARMAPEDPSFPGLPAAAAIETPVRVSEAARSFGADRRADAVAAIVAESSSRGLTAAGTVQMSDAVVAIASSTGVNAAQEATDVGVTVLSMGDRGGSGWASVTAMGPEGLDASALGRLAAETALRAQDPGDLAPGSYAVVLAPDAVAELLTMLAYTGFSARTFAEGSSFMTGHLGERILAPEITIVDDALAPGALGLTFDFEGMPKHRTPLVEAGVAIAPVTDSYWAARTGRPNTGHALPAPNAFGPYPLNIEMAPGDRTEDELVGSVERGVFVSRLHYVNVEDPVTVRLTGMTRDGTFLIENGRIGRPVKNQRFTQEIVAALSKVDGVGRQRALVGERGGASLVPALLLPRFDFTGQTG
jgi:PmbA protein